MQSLLAPISVGELIDKITILEIKQKKICNADKLANIQFELTALNKVWDGHKDPSLDITELHDRLITANERLWNIEDQIRIKEGNSEFDQEFIELARSVYFENDKRAAIKKEINLITGSDLIEEKEYQEY